MGENTISYNDKLNTLRQEIDYYKRLARRETLLRAELKGEIKKLRLENARLAELVDARFTKNEFLIAESKRLSDEAWRKVYEKAERYGGLLSAIKDILNQESIDEDDKIYSISRLIDNWYEQEKEQND